MKPVIIDFNNLARRFIHASALDDLKAGITPTGGVYGTLTSLTSFLTKYPKLGPVIACVDSGVPEHRLALLPDYKEKRKKKREDMSEADHKKIMSQMELIEEMFRLLGIAIVKQSNAEADDLIYCLCSHYPIEVMPRVISSDADLLQVIPTGAKVYSPATGKWITEKNFKEKIGIAPEHYVLYRTLTGDTSDGIKGAPGCGPKRAAEFINAWSPTSEVPSKQLRELKRSAEQLTKPRMFETAIISNYGQLQRVVMAIDLSRTDLDLDAVLKQSDDDGKVDERGFLKFCAKLRMRSVLGDPLRFVTPFRRAWKHR